MANKFFTNPNELIRSERKALVVMKEIKALHESAKKEVADYLSSLYINWTEEEGMNPNDAITRLTAIEKEEFKKRVEVPMKKLHMELEEYYSKKRLNSMTRLEAREHFAEWEMMGILPGEMELQETLYKDILSEPNQDKKSLASPTIFGGGIIAGLLAREGMKLGYRAKETVRGAVGDAVGGLIATKGDREPDNTGGTRVEGRFETRVAGEQLIRDEAKEVRLQEILNQNWAGGNWRDRIYDNSRDNIRDVLDTIRDGVKRGDSPERMRGEVSRRFDIASNDSMRLVRTETNYFQNQATLERYREQGITHFMFVATEDLATSDECLMLNGEVFSVEDTKAGVNVPPLHPNCRSDIEEIREPENEDVKTSEDAEEMLDTVKGMSDEETEALRILEMGNDMEGAREYKDEMIQGHRFGMDYDDDVEIFSNAYIPEPDLVKMIGMQSKDDE